MTKFDILHLDFDRLTTAERVKALAGEMVAADAVLMLLTGHYGLAGTVEGATRGDAFRLSQNIDAEWNPAHPARSTSTGDIIVALAVYDPISGLAVYDDAALRELLAMFRGDGLRVFSLVLGYGFVPLRLHPAVEAALGAIYGSGQEVSA